MENNAPVITSAASVSIEENTKEVMSISVANEENDTLTYSITGGDDSGLFTIDSATGKLSLQNAPDYEAPKDAGLDNTYGVEVTVRDDGEGKLSAKQTIIVTITDVSENKAPVITSGNGDTASYEVEENTTSVIATISATDEDNDTLTYKIIGGEEGDLFVIDFATGELKFAFSPDYEKPNDSDAKNTYVLEVMVSDNSDEELTDKQTITITVTDVEENTAPVITGKPAATAIIGQKYSFTPTASDEDNDDLTFSIVNLPTWATFETSTGTISGTPVGNNIGTYSNILITVKDAKLSSALTKFDIKVESPTCSVGSILSSDYVCSPCSEGKYFSDGECKACNVGYFNPDKGASQCKITPTGYFANLSGTAQATICPAGTYSDEEGSTSCKKCAEGYTSKPGSSKCTNIKLIDENSTYIWNDKIAWISLQEKNAQFELIKDHIEGYLWSDTIGWIDLGSVHTQKESHTYLNTTNENWGLNVDSSGNITGYAWNKKIGWIHFKTSESQVKIDDYGYLSGYAWNEKIGWISFSGEGYKPKVDMSKAVSIEIPENTTAVTKISILDISNDSLTFAITDGMDKSKFDLDSSTGELKFKSAPEFANPSDADKNNTYIVQVKATDTNKLTYSQTITVTIKDVDKNKAPVITSNDGEALSIDFAENSTETITTITATDEEDDNSALTFSLDGINKDLFSISSTGALTFIEAPDFENPKDEEKKNIYVVEVIVTDSGKSTDKQTITITITNEKDEANELETGTTVTGSTEETKDDGSKTTTVKLEDKDGNESETIIESKVVTSTVTKPDGIETKASTTNTEGTKSDITTKVNSNGTSKNIVETTDAQGNTSTTTVTSAKPGAKVNISKDGTVEVSHEEEDSSVKATVKGKETTQIVELKNSSGEKVQTKATSEVKDSTVEIKEDGTVQTKATTTTTVTKDDGSSEEKKVTVTVDGKADGKAVHILKVKDTSGIETITTTNVNLPGAQTNVSETGESETTVSTQNTIVTVKATPDGKVDNKVEITDSNGNKISSQTKSEILGATTTIGEEGSVSTSATPKGYTIAGKKIEAIVDTLPNGEAYTRFEITDLSTGKAESRQTLSGGTFEPGNGANIREENGKVLIDVTTKVTKKIVF